MGETKGTLNIRGEEHITAIKSASKKSHTAEHCWKYNHDFDRKHKKVLDFEKNWKTRTIKESIYSVENDLLLVVRLQNRITDSVQFNTKELNVCTLNYALKSM